MPQKLNMILEDIGEAQALGELWADSDVDSSLMSESFNNVTMMFDTQAGTVSVLSEMTNARDQPMFEWTMTPATGEVVEISRDSAGKSEKTIHKDVDPAELTMHAATGTVAATNTVSRGNSLNKLLDDPTVLSLEWQEAEA